MRQALSVVVAADVIEQVQRAAVAGMDSLLSPAQ